MPFRIIVDGTVVRIADEDPGYGRLTAVCSECYHEPEYDDPETCPIHPNAPLEWVRKLTADMLGLAQVELGGIEHPSPVTASSEGVTIGLTPEGQSIFSTAGRGQLSGVTQQNKLISIPPVGFKEQGQAPIIAATQGASPGVARQTELPPIITEPFQTFLPFLGGGMPRTAKLCQRNEWAECRLRNGLPVTADMDPAALLERK